MDQDKPSAPSSLADMAVLRQMWEEYRPRLLAMLERPLDPARAAPSRSAQARGPRDPVDGQLRSALLRRHRRRSGHQRKHRLPALSPRPGATERSVVETLSRIECVIMSQATLPPDEDEVLLL